MTNPGLQIELPLLERSGAWYGILSCQGQNKGSRIATPLFTTSMRDTFIRNNDVEILDSRIEDVIAAERRPILIRRSSQARPLLDCALKVSKDGKAWLRDYDT
jgi:hypothetical protein